MLELTVALAASKKLAAERTQVPGMGTKIR
jgi:hypothetical protein